MLAASQLNEECLCAQRIPADPQGLLYALSPVYISRAQLAQMQTLIALLERVLSSPAWAAQVLPQAPAVARHDPGYPSAMFGFDFHLDGRQQGRPQLIEINTNAGGAFAITQLAALQTGCCQPGLPAPQVQAQRSAQAIVESLLVPLRSAQLPAQGLVVILDEAPASQYLYPEFLLAAALLREQGLQVAIADPGSLQGGAQGLTLDGAPVRLIYNRLTDFYLAAPHLAALRAAYLAGTVALTPHPRAHALYADKRHLVRLTDPAQLAQLSLTTAEQALLLAGIPATRLVNPAAADGLWQARKSLFFKPAQAYGSKGAYQGAKMTRAVFQQLLQENYVAQQEVPPSRRQVAVGDEVQAFKLDIRCYVFQGRVQLVGARLWRGQTTNFRSAGGGFAFVATTPE